MRAPSFPTRLLAILALIASGLPRAASSEFAAFEASPVHGLALSLDGTRLFALNTPDARLEIFEVSDAGLLHLSSVPVGLEPVAVAERVPGEVWVVNQLSDSVSIVASDGAPRVVRTLLVGDEPSDVVFAGSPLRDPKNILSKRSIFFDLDSNLIKDEYKPVVAAHARYLQQNGGSKMRVEGNADERGSREYNLALGQRRADAVRQMMQILGAKADQLETLSFGEEKPRCSDAAESCHSQNRRGDIVYSGE